VGEGEDIFRRARRACGKAEDLPGAIEQAPANAPAPIDVVTSIDGRSPMGPKDEARFDSLGPLKAESARAAFETGRLRSAEPIAIVPALRTRSANTRLTPPL
jgi:hypothetical protein